MSFNITPDPATSGTFAVGGTSESNGFAVSGDEPRVPVDLDEFIQWQKDGVNLGAPDVQIVDFVGEGLLVTRGTGENSHVITVRKTFVLSYYTSRMYAYEGTEELNVGVSTPVGGYLILVPEESLNVGVSFPIDGELRDVTQTYTHSRPEELNIGVSTPQTGALASVVVTYTHSRPEELNVGVSTPQTGTLTVVLVSYTHSRPEEINIGVSTPQSGTLT